VTSAPRRRLRCALFVDFDNVYIGLQRLDPSAAEAFASAPGRWLAALETGSDDDGEFDRRFLVRSCYLNPSAFAQFRPNFTRAGFRVVDCPSLTQQGKSSADINLVLDVVDALSAPARYDEFVIVSADADFTPVALRCRADDRRVTVLTAGPVASAYRAVADSVITADELVEMVREPVVPAQEADEVAPASGNGRSTTATKQVSPARRAVLRLVRTADKPLAGGAVATAAQQADPTLPSGGWDGAGSFFAWLTRTLPELASATKPAPGWVWDPRRFSEADLPGSEPVDLPPLQRQVVEVTDIPNLTAPDYRTLLRTLAKDLAAHGFERPDTAVRVRDACQKGGHKIGKGSVNTVISGLLFAGLDLATKPPVEVLARTWADNVVGLCRGARMELGHRDEAAIRAWVAGGLAG
jgi:hypothetical protein